MKKLLFACIALLISHLSFSQLQKVGYVYDDYIMVNYNEVKNLQNEVAAKREAFTKELQAKTTAYQEKYAQYQQSMKDITNVTTESLNATLKQVQDLKREAEAYQQTAETELQTLVQNRYKEIREKVDAATKKVAAEKGYKFVFRRNADAANRESTPILLYANDNGRDNLSDAILVKLGSTPPKPQPTAPVAQTPATKKPAPKK